MKRIQFFSIYDGASGYYLKEGEKLLSQIDLNKDLDINDLLERYNIKLYFDNGLYLNSWDKQKRDELKEKTNACWQLVKSFFLKLDSETIETAFDQVLFQYRSNFWEIINQLEIYKKISEEVLQEILDKYPKEIRNILQEERIVRKFSESIRTFLLANSNTAELILSASEEHNSRNPRKLFFPKSLSDNDKEKIIQDYLDSEKPNLNYVSLVEFTKDSTLKLSDKTKLKAKRITNKISNDLLNSDLTSSHVYGVEVALNKEQIVPVTYRNESNTLTVTYSYDILINVIKSQCLSCLFKEIFFFLDEQGLITLVSKTSEINTMESIFMRSKNEYFKGLAFSKKNMLSLAQIALTQHLLKVNTLSLNDLIKTYLKKNSEYDGELSKLRFTFPTESLSDVEKIRLIAPELESLLKQYQLYLTDGEIDFELLGISSTPVNFSQIQSNVENKYLYANQNTNIGELFHPFFSNQGFLHYIDLFKDKYDNFYSLLTSEDVRLENFEDYQVQQIDKLISENHLYVDENGMLRIRNVIKFYLLKKLYENEVLSYWHFPPNFRNEMDKMLDEKLCYSKSTLFTDQEIAYLNYYLNKREFTDGPDLRNKYLHGTNPSSAEENSTDFAYYLRIVILCLLKIEEDLHLYQELNN